MDQQTRAEKKIIYIFIYVDQGQDVSIICFYDVSFLLSASVHRYQSCFFTITLFYGFRVKGHEHCKQTTPISEEYQENITRLTVVYTTCSS